MPSINDVRRFGDRIGAPRVANEVVNMEPRPGASPLFDGRQPTGPKDVKFASRNIAPAELADIRASGYALPPKGGSRYTAGGADKWWSAADDEGVFGRSWKNTDNNLQIRAPIEEVPANRAVPARVIQALDESTGTWGPINAARGAAFKTALGQIARRVAGPVGAASVGADIGNVLYDAVVPRYKEGESIMAGSPKSDLQRLWGWMRGR